MRSARALLWAAAFAAWLGLILGLDYDAEQTRDICIAAVGSVLLGLVVGRWEAVIVPIFAALALTGWAVTFGRDPTAHEEIPAVALGALLVMYGAAAAFCIGIGVLLRWAVRKVAG